ncbi:hypothetical protein [Pannonibacter sp. SL95]|uniref:hypothetical protein n=1 Tax=Pannonibacter sp. SL95 TaxID=2995153 RepID=UPI002276CBC1|nr:hypothetical protein [Pannonibacter sp. SL95]MCY1708345.1 hypothetical protein [Pannonibacter sp. SL95]
MYNIELMIQNMARHVWGRRAIAVSPDAPGTYEDLVQHINGLGPDSPILIFDGGNDDTVYEAEWTNVCFRAWHDWCHYTGGFDFSPEGERQAVEMQCRMLVTHYGINATTLAACALLRAEVVGQAAYFAYTGDFPKNQRAFMHKYLQEKFAA